MGGLYGTTLGIHRVQPSPMHGAGERKSACVNDTRSVRTYGLMAMGVGFFYAIEIIGYWADHRDGKGEVEVEEEIVIITTCSMMKTIL